MNGGGDGGGLPVGWEGEVVRAYEVFGVWGGFVDALTPQMRSLLAKRRRRDTREGHEGEFLEERGVRLPGGEVRGDLGRPGEGVLADVAADVAAWEDRWMVRPGDDDAESYRKAVGKRSRGDYATAIMLTRLGANGRPLVLPPEEFAGYEGERVEVGVYEDWLPVLDGDGVQVVRGEEVFWRGLSARRNPKPMVAVVEGIGSAPPEEYYIGQGLFGNGTYLGDPVAAEYAASRVPVPGTGTQITRNGSGALVRFKLKPGTRLVEWNGIPEEVRRQPPDLLAAWVVLNGYHGIDATKESDWFGGLNILDRSRLVMEALVDPGAPSFSETVFARAAGGDVEGAAEMVWALPFSPLRDLALETLYEGDIMGFKRCLEQLEGAS